MNCQDFLARLQTLLDQHRDPQTDATLRRHAAGCEACGERLEAQDRLFMALAMAVSAAGEPACSKDSQFAAGDSDSRDGAGRRVGKLAAFGLASAAALLLCAWGILPTNRPLPEMATRSITSPAAPNVVASRATGESAFASDRNVVPATPSQRGGGRSPATGADGTQVASRTGETVRKDSPLPPPALPRSPDFDWDFQQLGLQNIGLQTSLERFNDFYETVASTPPIPESSVPQVEQLAEEVRPLTQPFVSVLNVLRRTWPGGKTPADPPTGDQSWRQAARVHLT